MRGLRRAGRRRTGPERLHGAQRFRFVIRVDQTVVTSRPTRYFIISASVGSMACAQIS